jgi:flagellar motility protein MotE (MotC chaperone)
MRKFILSCQIVIVVFFAVRILFLMEVLPVDSMSSVSSLGSVEQAIAQTKAPGANTSFADKSTANTSSTKEIQDVKDVTDDPLKKERDLFSSLQKKQKDLELRESALKAEEEKGLALKKEIMEKIDVLKALEAQLSTKLDMDKASEGKRLQDLAKVYEAAPPQKAAAMLEQLDLKTAARITINMKREKAGLIWGYLTPQKAVGITNEITRTAHTAAE